MKIRLIQHCFDILQGKITSLQEAIQKTQESANNETKSTAGDKYETGRAMAQLEIDQLKTQLIQFQNMLSVLKTLSNESSDFIKKGSLVTTNKGNYFIAVSLGEVIIENQKVFIISDNAPVAKAMLGKKRNDSFVFNTNTFEIKDVQ